MDGGLFVLLDVRQSYAGWLHIDVGIFPRSFKRRRIAIVCSGRRYETRGCTSKNEAASRLNAFLLNVLGLRLVQLFSNVYLYSR